MSRTHTFTFTLTATATVSATFTITETHTLSPTATESPTPTGTYTVTSTATPPPPFFRVDRNRIGPGEAVTVSWRLTAAGHVQLSVFNSAGEFIRLFFDRDVTSDEVVYASWDATNWKGEKVASNIYVLRAIAPRFIRNYKVGVTQ